MNKAQVEYVARSSALHVVSTLREAVDDMVAHAITTRIPVPEDKTAEPWSYRRLFRQEEPTQPVSNFAQILMEQVKWQKGKGAQIASTWLFKPDSSHKLLVEQYGTANPECSILRFDRAYKRSVISNGGDVTTVGTSPWIEFKSGKGNIDFVVGKLKENGWIVQPSSSHNATVQLSLVDVVQEAVS